MIHACSKDHDARLRIVTHADHRTADLSHSAQRVGIFPRNDSIDAGYGFSGEPTTTEWLSVRLPQGCHLKDFIHQARSYWQSFLNPDGEERLRMVDLHAARGLSWEPDNK